MISRTIDVSDALNAAHYAIEDLGLWETITIQAVGLAGTCNIEGTNDGGSITGSVEDSARNAANFTAVQAINLTTGAAATAVTGTTLFRITPFGFKYLRLGDGSTATATKLLIHCTKPY